MADYLFLQSQEPFTEARTAAQYQLAMDLADSGAKVQMLLVQNGVVPARKLVEHELFAQLLKSPVTILADEFSLQQRQIDASQIHEAITPAAISMVIQALADGHKVIWN